MDYRILRENKPNLWETTGETLQGSEEEAQARIQVLKDTDPEGKCHAAEAFG